MQYSNASKCRCNALKVDRCSILHVILHIARILHIQSVNVLHTPVCKHSGHCSEGFEFPKGIRVFEYFACKIQSLGAGLGTPLGH